MSKVNEILCTWLARELAEINTISSSSTLFRFERDRAGDYEDALTWLVNDILYVISMPQSWSRTKTLIIVILQVKFISRSLQL